MKFDAHALKRGAMSSLISSAVIDSIRSGSESVFEFCKRDLENKNSGRVKNPHLPLEQEDL
jgi:hypothetical protein